MIQRIQTIYLLGIIALLVLCFYFPFAEFIDAAGHNDWYSLKGLSSGKAGKSFSQILTFAAGLAVGVSFITIFLYKKRKQQMLACLINIVVLIVMNILVFIQIGQLKQELSLIANYKLPAVFPLVGAVLAFMAYRAIKSDDNLVKSYDRLR